MERTTLKTLSVNESKFEMSNQLNVPIETSENGNNSEYKENSQQVKVFEFSDDEITNKGKTDKVLQQVKNYSQRILDLLGNY